jgi:glycosyltransferase involved in cell wall biosynthesis
MPDIKFSVVIPTRERAATLRHCLRTCIDQNFDDYEVIVSDNNSSPETRAVVDESGAHEVRYVRTPRALSLASSWEFAVSQARGEYVMLIGDDDGLLPHCLAELDKLTHDTGHKVIRWDSAFYTWPNCALVGEGDYLRIPLGTGTEEFDGLEAIKNVIGFKQLYTTLPMIYNSVVHKDILASIRAKSGRLFANRYADVYSGFSIAHSAGKYLSIESPMSISGQSSASTGVAVFFFRNRSSIDREFRDLSDNENMQENKQIPDLSIFPYTAVADSFLDAKRLLFPNDGHLVLDQKRFIELCVRNLRVENADDWQKALQALRSTLSGVSRGFKWFDRGIGRTEFRPHGPFRLRPDRLGSDGQYLHLDAAVFDVQNVAGAAELCDRILNYRRCGSPHYHTSNSSAIQLALQQVCDERLVVIEQLQDHIKKLDVLLAKRHWSEITKDTLKRLKREIQHVLQLAMNKYSNKISSLKNKISSLKNKISSLKNKLTSLPKSLMNKARHKLKSILSKLRRLVSRSN